MGRTHRQCLPSPGPGSCADAQLRALQFIADAEEVVLASNSSWLPLGESVLAAAGIRLSNEELGLPPGSPPRAALTQQFLRGGGSEDALRLAAQSSEWRAPVSCSISWNGLCGLGFPRPGGSWESRGGGCEVPFQAGMCRLSKTLPNPPAAPPAGPVKPNALAK